MISLTGRSALVTGSTSGIGAGIAAALEACGAAVIRHGLPPSTEPGDCNPAPPEGNDEVLFADIGCNLPESAHLLATEALRRKPETDLLVANAGTFIDEPFLQMDYSVFLKTLQLNVCSQFVLVQEFARHWVRRGVRGRIVLTGSINGRLSEPTHVAYDTSKGAVEAMVRSLSVSLAPHGIRVNGLAPGLLRTPLTESAVDDARFRRWMELHTPNGTVPGPEACGGTAAFLLSDAAEHMHGQMLFVDGGMSIWQQPDPPDNWT